MAAILNSLRTGAWLTRERIRLIALALLAASALGIAFLLGIRNAVDLPTRQSFAVEMVGREDVGNAVALNSAMFNGARVIGPAVAVPLRTAEGVVGAMALGWSPVREQAYRSLDTRLPASFAEQAALALQVVRSREAEQRLALFERQCGLEN